MYMLNIRINHGKIEIAPPNAKLGKTMNGYWYVELYDIPDHLSPKEAVIIYNSSQFTKRVNIINNRCNFAQFGVEIDDDQTDIYNEIRRNPDARAICKIAGTQNCARCGVQSRTLISTKAQKNYCSVCIKPYLVKEESKLAQV